MEKSIANRIILLVAGIALAVSALWGGSEMHMWAMQGYTMTDRAFPLVLTTVLGTAATAIGLVLYGLWIAYVTDEDEYAGDTGSMMAVSVIAICFCFVLGAIGVGTDIASRLTPWDSLLVLGSLPILFEMKTLLADILGSGQKGR